MDKLKDFMRQVVKYRFWILVGVASLMPVVAYLVSAGSIEEATTKGAAQVKQISTDVKQYTSGVFPNSDYKVLADERVGIISKDVKQAWRVLYEQQAPLLSWPPEVENEFKAWGITQWPKDSTGKDVDDALVAQVINTYIQVYPQQVERVYESFRPFNYDEGSGIVAAPPQDVLLRPAGFSQNRPPTYGKVVAAQQRLWIQATLLDVVGKVNGSAKIWDNAPIKQIIALEAANSIAQGQQSIARGEALELAPEIIKPGTEVAAPTAAAPAAPAELGSIDPTMMKRRSGGGGGANRSQPDEVYFLAAKKPDQPYRDAPVYLAVLIDQSRLLDVFEKFRDSPMAIQVVDFEMKRPATRVKKPVKGEAMALGDFYRGGNEFLLGMSGGLTDSMMRGVYGGRGGMQHDGLPGSGLGYMGGVGQPSAKKGVDIRQKAIEAEKTKKTKKDETKKEKTGTEATISDPYFNIVELHIYGQAKFYNPPPPDQPETETDSDAKAAMSTGTEATKGEPSKTETAQPASSQNTAAPAAAVTP